MPAISCDTYQPPYPGGHLQTILPKLFRKRKLPDYERERVTTPDNDFIDLDWIKKTAPGWPCCFMAWRAAHIRNTSEAP